MIKQLTVLSAFVVASLFVTTGVYADSTVNTGNTKADVTVTTEGGMNQLTISGGQGGSTEVEVSDNGAFSENEVVVNRNTNFVVNQTNNTTVNNNISVNANTGGVFAIGSKYGDTDIQTGD